jgi:hypothetical protein
MQFTEGDGFGGAPAVSTCTISPTSVTPHGSAISTANVSIKTAARAVLPPMNWPRTLRPFPSRTALLAGVVVLFVLAFLRLPRDAHAARAPVSISMGFALLLVPQCNSCAGGGSHSSGTGTPPVTYTVTLTGNSQSLIRTATITFTVN